MDFKLPRPMKLGNRNRWPNRAWREWLANMKGLPPPPAQPDDDHLIDSKELRKRLGNVSNMYLHRHMDRSSGAEDAAA
jgi:hypothetical protein